MKAIGSLAIAVIVGIVVLWVLLKLVFVALGLVFKLIGLAIAVAVVAAVFFGVRHLIEGPR